MRQSFGNTISRIFRESIHPTIVLAAIIVGSLALAGCEKSDVVDYGIETNWAVCESEQDDEKAADVFFICPSAVGGSETELNMNISDEAERASFLGATLMEKGIYDDNARFFAPYYRQATLQAYGMPEEERGIYLDYAYADIKTAFDFYMKNYNCGRPVILAGFSQGSDMLKRLMIDYGNDDGFKNQLVASYMIGWNITGEELREHRYIKMAEGEADTGVIVSFCSESEDTVSTLIVPETTKGINPLSWTCDSEPADKTLNLGGCFVDSQGEVKEEIGELTGAYLDPERGTLKVTDISKEDYPAKLSFLRDGDYHIYDYMFFYRNLEKNVQTRIAQYLSLKKIRDGKFSQDYITKIRDSVNNRKAGEKEEHIGDVRYAVTVSDEMCTAEYWINRRPNPDDILLDAEGIAEFNDSQNHSGTNPESFYYYVGDDRATQLSGAELEKLLLIFNLPPKNTELFYTDGNPVDEEFWEELTALRDIENVQSVNPVRYGVALRSVGVKKGPSELELAAGTQYDYCDELQNSSVRMNEALIVLWESSDKEWYYVASPYCLGWVKQEDVGVTSNYDFWVKSLNPEEFLIVTDNHAFLDNDPSDADIASRALDMGTKLALVTDGSFAVNNYGRYALNNYIVKLPCRYQNGGLYYKNVYLPQNIGVHEGYLDYTQRNILTLAFEVLGEQYGWAGLYNNRDCSQYMKEIYKCFGIELPRNTSSMLRIPWTSVNVTGLSSSSKREILATMPAGTLLIFPGHVMMYLGEENGVPYCISATGSAKLDPDADVQRIRSVMVNSLEGIWRGNGKTWLESITYIKMPY